jgi:hypothetical protein
MATPKQHARTIDNTINQIRGGVFDNLKQLEERIAELVLLGADPTILRPQVIAEFNRFQNNIKSVASEVKEISQSTGVSSPEDSNAERILVEQSQNTIASEFSGGAEKIMNGIVVGAAAGLATDFIAKQARASISGVMLTSDDREIRKQQRIMKRKGATPEEIAKASNVIKQRLEGINTTASLRDLTNRATEQVVMKFDGAYTFGKAKREGLTRFQYEGGIVNESREWCREHVGEIYTEEEIYDLWNSDWQGKEPGDPFVVRGGYNCRHFWIPVEE